VARSSAPWIGRLGLRLALVFVAVALAAVAAVIIFGSVATTRSVDQLIGRQRVAAARATAVAAAAAYDHVGWQHANVSGLTRVVSEAGAAVQVRNMSGRVIHSSPRFASYRGEPQLTVPVVVQGRQIGRVTLRFEHRGLAGAIAHFQAQRWPAWFTAAGVAALIAVTAALLVSHRITESVDRLINAARARGRGEHGARVGDVGGLGEIRELAQAFDHMADASEEQDRLRRNLVADVAHELRTPIAVLQAGHEAMLDGLAEPSAENLGSQRDEVLRLARIVDDLQRLASAEAAALQLTLVPCDLAAIVRSAAARLADSFDAADVSIRWHLSVVQAMCDPARMHEVVTNLLTNALKFTPAGGTVLVETVLVETVPGRPDSEHALLKVSDTGIGILPEDLPRVSDRFFRSARTSGIAGSGIGLTIVAEVVRGHHGTMDITSEPGFGTKVTIRLPVADAPHRSERQRSSLKHNRQQPAQSGKNEAEPGTGMAGRPLREVRHGCSENHFRTCRAMTTRWIWLVPS
jgi:two-component system sensor histidine kinase BaeS